MKQEQNASPLRRRLLGAVSTLGALAVAMTAGAASAAPAIGLWQGTISTDWFDGGNWADGFVPALGQDVRIVDPVTNMPVIGGAAAQAGSIFLGANPGANLTIGAGGSLTSANAVVGNSTINMAVPDLDKEKGTVSILGGGVWDTTSLTLGAYGFGVLDVGAGGQVDVATTASMASHAGSRGSATISGAGATWRTGNGFSIGSGGLGEFNLLAGAKASDVAVTLGQQATGRGVATVDGAGTTWELRTGSMVVGNLGTGEVTVSGGAKVSVGFRTQLGLGADSDGRMTVTGAGSSLTSTEYVGVGMGSTGTLNVLNGGAVVGRQFLLGFNSGGDGKMLVSGAGSLAHATTTAPNVSPYFMVGYLGKGEATAADGGTIRVTGGSGVRIAYDANSTGVLNIGAAEGQAAAGAGFIEADSLSFGPGAGTLVFNHTGQDYRFAAPISGAGTIKVLSGETVLTGDNSAFSGNFSLTGGALVLGHDNAPGSATLNLQGATLGFLDGVRNDNSVVLNSATTRLSVATGTAFQSGVISEAHGKRTLEKTGAGELVLVGGHSYTGGTLISQGTLTGNTKNLIGDIVNNAALKIDQDTNGTFTGAVSGSGAVTKAGSGTVTLGSALTHTGGTLISGGALVGSTATLAGAITNNAALTIDQGTNGTFTGAVSGSGVVTKAGSGTVTLGSALTHTGGTLISGGALVGSTATLSGAITNNAALTIAQDADGVFSASVTGSGLVTKTGSGAVTLGSALTHTGGTLISGGSLAGSTSTLTGSIVNNAALTIAQNSDGVFTANVTGSGAVTKTGSGAVTLSSALNHTGGTLISGGTLTGSTSTLTGAIVNNAALTIAQEKDGAFTANVTGSGLVTKTGAGAVTLTGALGHTGGTLISGGALVGSTATLTGDIVNNATLKIVQDNDGVFAGNLSGSGDLIKDGAGTVRLTGNLTYTGATSVLAGRLIGNTSTISGPVDNRTGLEFEQIADGTYSSNIAGSGGFVKSGPGVLILTGNSTYTGPTTIQSGQLTVNGSLVSNVLIQNGAALGGSGAVGGVNVMSGGTVTPGNSIGTLRINGDVTFAAGSVYEVETDPLSDATDLIAATGTATINGGLVRHIAYDGRYLPESSYTILTAAGGVTGRFDGVESDFAFLDAGLSYGQNAVVMTLQRNDISFSSIGRTLNQRAVGAAVETAGRDAAIYRAAVSLDDDTARSAFDAMSGEIHGSIRSGQAEAAGRLRNALLARMDGASGDGATVWAQATGAHAAMGKDGNAAGFSDGAAGLLTGVDAMRGSIRLGVAGGLSEHDYDNSARFAGADGVSWSLAGYGAARLGALRLQGGVSGTWTDVESARGVVFTGFTERLTADYDAMTAQVFADAAWDFALGDSTLSPFATIARVQTDTDGFTETGGAAALDVAGDVQAFTTSTLGVGVSHAVAQGECALVLSGRIGWRHAWGDVDGESRHSFAAAPSGSFVAYGAPIAEDALSAQLGLDFRLTERATIGVRWDGQMADDLDAHEASGRFAWSF